jgi:predicted metal-dependent HD superfamily phosphohydrolase
MYPRKFYNLWNSKLQEAARLEVCLKPDCNYGVATRIIEHYSNKRKDYYHDLSHINDCLRRLKLIHEFEEVHDVDFLKIYFAIIFHDIKYDTTRVDNEINSSEFWYAESKSLGFVDEFIEEVKEMILSTAHTSSVKDKPLHYQYLIDIDLSIFGASKKKFKSYCNKIRFEYNWVPDSIYNANRKQILQNFLDRDRIYNTEIFYNKFEKRARKNLKEAIELLIE